MTLKDLTSVISNTAPVEIGIITDHGPTTIRLSQFREEVLDRMGISNRNVVIIRIDSDDYNKPILRICID